MITATLLITTSMLASALTAATGVGGGTLLLLVMAWVLPLPVAIPLHSAVQLFSNGSRAWLIREHIRHKIVVPMLIGGCFGAVIGAPLIFSETVTNWLPVIFGALVLIVVWLPLPAINHLTPPTLLCLGFFINGIGSLISAIGPITASTLRTQMDNKLQTVATLAAIVCGFGVARVFTYTANDFLWGQWLALLAGMLISGYVGTRLGLHWLNKLSEHLFSITFKLILTGMALVVIARALI